MIVPYVNLGLQYTAIESPIIERIKTLFSTGSFILGEEVSEFETSFAKLCGSKYALGVANGTDALVLALQAIGIKPGDEVITAPNSYLASASSIVLAGAIPVFADVDMDLNIDPKAVERKINHRTKAIIPVHLTGNPAKMNEILALAKKHHLKVIEDAAQAVGAKYHGKVVGSLGDLGCFSLHPLKNLGAAGDAGMITTNNIEYYNHLIKARNHGLKNRDECEFYSLNSRLDSIQAAILNVKIQYLNQWNARRREIAGKYIQALSNLVEIPLIDPKNEAVFHAFVIQVEAREKLIDYLKKSGIDTKIHYPIPIHDQKASKAYIDPAEKYEQADCQKSRILSLPVYPELTDEQIDYVIKKITDYYKQQ